MTVTVTPPPSPPPSRSDPENFAARGDAYHAWLESAVPAMNSQHVENNNLAVAIAEDVAAALAAGLENAAANATTATTQATAAASSAATASAHKDAAAASATSAAASATSAGTAGTAAANVLIGAVTQRPRITPSLSVDWTLKPTAAALTAAGWTVTRTGEITSFGAIPTKAAENLFTYSQDFTNAIWVKQRATVSAVTDESGLVGSLLIADTQVSTSHYLYFSATNTNIGAASYRVRFLCKAATYTKAFIFDPSIGRAAAAFDLAAGTIIGTGFGAGYVSHSMTPHELGGGLYWCELVMTSSAAGTNWNAAVAGYPDSFTPSSAGSALYTGDGVSGIEVYAAQLQQGFDGDYLPTTANPITLYEPQLVTTAANELAYQHNASGECIGLVQYPADTNNLWHSQNLAAEPTSGAIQGWKKNSVTVTSSKRKWAGNVPFWRLRKDIVGEASLVQTYSFTALAATTAHSFTIALLADQWSACSSVVLGIKNETGNSWPAAAGQVISGPGSVSGTAQITVTGLSTTVPTLVRVTAQVPSGTTSIGAYIYPETNGEGTANKAILATRVHLSASPRLMPYIPTTAAAVTRGAQTLTFGGSAFAAVNNPAQGTLLVKASVEDAVFDVTRYMAQLQTGTAYNVSNRLGFASNAATALTQAYTVAFGVSQASDTNIGSISTTPQTMAYSFASNAFTPAMNGVVDTTDTAGVVPVVDKLQIGWGLSGTTVGDPACLIQRTELYPRAMTPAELAAITTPGVL